MVDCKKCGNPLQENLFGSAACYVCSSPKKKRRDTTVIAAPIEGDPEWLQASGTLPKRHIINARMGLHPVTGLKVDESTSCKTCLHCYKKTQTKTYYKCGVAKGSLADTDTKLRYPGCSSWNEKGELF